MSHSRIYLRIIIFIFILIWCAGFSFRSLTGGSEISIASFPVFNFFYDNICHQNKEKIISVGGFSFLVCARCSGIYLGALFTSFFLLFFLKKIKISSNIFLIVSILLASDVIANNFLFNSYIEISAFVTGIFFGAVCFIIFLNLVEEHLIKAEY